MTVIFLYNIDIFTSVFFWLKIISFFSWIHLISQYFKIFQTMHWLIFQFCIHFLSWYTILSFSYCKVSNKHNKVSLSSTISKYITENFIIALYFKFFAIKKWQIDIWWWQFFRFYLYNSVLTITEIHTSTCSNKWSKHFFIFFIIHYIITLYSSLYTLYNTNKVPLDVQDDIMDTFTNVTCQHPEFCLVYSKQEAGCKSSKHEHRSEQN